jgi:peptidoglycan/LPS O-acetylase OafA/YrhL
MLFIGSAWTFMIVKYDMFVFGGHYGITGPNQSFFISSTLLFAGIIGVISSGIIKAEFLNFKPLNYLGRISYGLYIWHPFVNIVVDVVLYRGYFTFITGWYVVASKLILTVVVASISYFYLELPFLRLKEKYTK